MPRIPATIVVLALLLVSFGRAEERDERPWAEQAFLGLSIRDTATGPVVGWIRPGPLGAGRARPGAGN